MSFGNRNPPNKAVRRKEDECLFRHPLACCIAIGKEPYLAILQGLSSRGMLSKYPQLAWNQLEDRAKVSELTLWYELAAREAMVVAELGKLSLFE